MSLAGSRFSSESAPRPFQYGIRGRGGNRFIVGKDGDRDQVCNKSECEQLPDMDVSSLAGCDLVCFCAPHRCHGDSILLKANFRVVVFGGRNYRDERTLYRPEVGHQRRRVCGDRLRAGSLLHPKAREVVADEGLDCLCR
jgi:hypothetical protein